MNSSIVVLLTALFFSFSSAVFSQAEINHSGSWFNPDRNGEGFHVQILDTGQALVIWFTYPGTTDNAQTEQAWVLGVGDYSAGTSTITITDAFRATGPVFGDAFDTTDLERIPWGSLTVTFSGANDGTVDYAGLDGAGSTQITRLTNLIDSTTDTSLPPGISGAWFDPITDGQGWFVEILTPSTALVYWFTYDANGNQAWNLGIGNIFDRQIVLPDNLAGTGTGFGAAFKAADINLAPFGTLIMEFADCAAGSMSYLLASGAISGSFPLVRLTNIDGYACGSIEQPKLQQSVMVNSADPLVTQYFGRDNTQVNLFGKKSASGRLDRLNSGFLQTPEGQAINFEVDAQGEVSQVVDNDSNITMTTETDKDGNVSIVLNDPANGVSASVAAPGPVTAQKAASAVTGTQAAGSKAEILLAGEGTVLVEVELCGQPATSAQVNFRIDDQLVIPATRIGPGQYQTELPTSLGPEATDAVVESVCSDTADQFATVCDFVSGEGAGLTLGTDVCLQLGAQISATDPAAGAKASAVCATASAAFSSACSANELRADTCGPTPEKVYRDFSSVRISAQATVLGLVGAVQTPEVLYDTPSEQLVLPKLMIPGQPYYISHTVTPVMPQAGETYTVDLHVGCVNEGQPVTITNITNKTTSQCTVDAQGNCQATVASNPGETFNVLEISATNGLHHEVVQSLAASEPNTGPAEFWRVIFPIDDNNILQQAYGIRHPNLYVCEFSMLDGMQEGFTIGPWIWDEALDFYVVKTDEDVVGGFKIENGKLCVLIIDDDNFEGPQIDCTFDAVKVGTWAAATQGDNGNCGPFP